jgi:REP element-mobilizing transposase RayT
MSTYTKILYQIVYGGKNFTTFLNENNEDPLYAYIAGILKNKNCFPYIIGGHKNHVHIITSIHPAIALADLVKDVKTYSNKFMKDKRKQYGNFVDWQVGYGAFTYDISHKETLIDYVKGQKTHHQKLSYKEELIGLLEEFGIEYDERYLLV